MVDSLGGAGARVCFEEIETGREARALAMVNSVLNRSGLEREQVECVAVALGPGSYNGIRSAIALAQGWQLGRGVKLLGLSSADVLAAQAQAAEIEGQVAVVIDAQREELYLATYQMDQAGYRQVTALRLTTVEEARQAEQAGMTLVGPEVTKWFPNGRLLFPRASTVGQLAANRSDFVFGEQLEPIYLRATSFVKAPPARRID